MRSFFSSRLSALHILSIVYLVYLPWSVFTKVFLTDKIGIPGIGLLREILLALVLCAVIVELIRARRMPKLALTDYLIGAYIAVGLIVSIVVHAPLQWVIAGARFDYEFLIAFVIFRHGAVFLPWALHRYFKVALFSLGAAFLVGLLVRFVFGETILLHVGFSPYLSQWSFGQGVPIYHGVMGAGVRRFQGIWDGPNPAAIAIVMFIALLIWVYGTSRKYSVFVWPIVAISLVVVLLTYSRSSILAMLFGGILVAGFFIKALFKKYLWYLSGALLALLILWGGFWLRYEGTMVQIVQRDGSSKGHAERFAFGMHAFAQQPFGYGLGYAGPAYRYSIGPSVFDALSQAEKDRYEFERIPESWYVQVLEESGFIGLILFVGILVCIFFQTLSRSVMLAWALAVLSIMSVVLHTFESLYVSCFLFALIGLLIGKTERIGTVKYKIWNLNF